MKNLTKILVTGLIETLIITGCARQATTEMEDAKAAINAVVQAKGDVYAKDELNKLYDDLQAAIDEIDAQSKKLFKKYGRAKEMLAKIVTDADEVKALIPARIEKNKSTAFRAQVEAETAVAEAKALLEKAPKGLEKVNGKSESLEIYRFPWPPPSASAAVEIPRKYLVRDEETTLLKDVNRIIELALDKNEYDEKKYYAVPAGFALVTRMERIESDGTPMRGKKRWALELQPLSRFSFSEYLKALLGSDPGYYRIFVFIVTPHAFEQSGAEISAEEAKEWFRRGMNKLPIRIGEMNFSNEYSCSVLIYEFERVSETQSPKFCLNGLIPGRTHLIKAGIWEKLQQ